MDDLVAQLGQLHQALQSADEASKPGIQQLINDIQELLGVTSGPHVADSLLQGQQAPVNTSLTVPVDEDDEFLKFQVNLCYICGTHSTSDLYLSLLIRHSDLS
jgi:hypothetical protein